MFSMFGSKPKEPPVVEWGAASPLAAAAGAGAAIPPTNGRISPKNSRSKKNEIIVGNPLDTPERKGQRLHQLIRDYVNIFNKPEYYKLKKKSPYNIQNEIERDALVLIRENVDFNTKDNHDMTTLLNACRRANQAIALAILEKPGSGIDINAKGNEDDEFIYGNTPLIEACNSRLEKVALKLIEMGANLDMTNTWNYTALMFACKNGLLPVVVALIDKGANTTLTDIGGETALDLTCGHLREMRSRAERYNELNAYKSSSGPLFSQKKDYIAIARLLLRSGLRSEQCKMFEELMPRPPSGPRPSAGAGEEAAGNSGPTPPSYPRGAAGNSGPKPPSYPRGAAGNSGPRPPSYPRGAAGSSAPLLGGKRRSKRTRHRKGKRPFSSRKNRR